MKRILLLLFLCVSAFAQRQNPLWTIIGRGTVAPSTCSGNVIFIISTDGSYRYCNGSSFVNPFLGISGIGSLNGLTDATQTFARTNDTNVTLAITSASPTHTFALGWTGTLAAGRLNSNVVQGITNDTNVSGSISAQNLTLGWAGTLAKARQNSATVYNDAANTWSTGLQDLGAATLKIPSGAGFTAGSSSMLGYDSTNKNFHGYLNAADAIIPGFASAPTNGHCLQAAVVSGNILLSDAGAACGTGAGTVTSVFETVPSWLSVSGSPVTTSGTLAISAATGQTSHKVIGTCGTATSFAPCDLVSGDIPILNQNTTGNAATATALASLPGSTGDILINSAGALGAAPVFSNATALAQSANAVVVPTCSGTCATTYTYVIVDRNVVGGAPSSSGASVVNAAALDGSHFNTLTLPACPASVKYKDVYRAQGPPPVGLISPVNVGVACSGVLVDNGLPVVAPFTSQPSADYSVGTGSSIPYVNTSNGSSFGCAAYSNPYSVRQDAGAGPQDNGSGLSVLALTSCTGFGYTALDADLMVDSDLSGSAAQVTVEMVKDVPDAFESALNVTAQSFGHTFSQLNSVNTFAATDTANSGSNLANYSNAIQLYSGASLAAAYTGFSTTTVDSGASLGTGYGWWFDKPGGTGAITNWFTYYQKDLGTRATNGYYEWFDSRGVFRIKEDNSFNSVGQAIAALYNPQFTKYTPGASDFERIIEGRWNSNVAEMGAEAGGTGTLRRIRLIGASAQLPSGSSDPGCTTGDIGNTWVDTSSSATTNLKVCAAVASTPTWGTLVNTAVSTLSSLASVGTITTGTWQATKLDLTYGGTNADLSGTGGTSQVLKQTSVGGAITVARLACSDLSNAATTCSSATAGTPPFSAITAGTNAAALLVGTGGSLGTSGTGTIAATSVTNLTLANTLTTSGNFPLTLTTTASTSVTLPTSGTLATLAGTETLSAKTLTAPIVSVLKPVSDSATAITATKADGTTAVVTVDTTGKRLLVGDLSNTATVLLDGPGHLVCFVTFNGGLCANNAALGFNTGFYTTHLLGSNSVMVAASNGFSVGPNTGNSGFEVTSTGSVAMNGPVGIGPLNYTSLTSTLNVTDKTATTGATRFVIGLGAADSSTTVTSTNAGTTKAAGYQSSDGSPGVTGATCTSFKNGLCVTL